MSADPIAGNASFTQVFTLPNQLPSVNTTDLLTTNIASTNVGLLAFFGAKGFVEATRPTIPAADPANLATTAGAVNDIRSALIAYGLVV